jgi:hypothetical protein
MLFVLMAMAGIAAPSAYANISGGSESGNGSGSCQVCVGAYDPATHTSLANCAAPDNWGWGYSQCQVTCYSTREFAGTFYFGSCTCQADGWGCLVIYVTAT